MNKDITRSGLRNCKRCGRFTKIDSTVIESVFDFGKIIKANELCRHEAIECDITIIKHCVDISERCRQHEQNK